MFILTIAGTGVWQSKFPRYFPNTKKYAEVAPGNLICLPYSATTFDFNQAANTHTVDNWMVPFACEVVALNYSANAAQVYTNNNLALAIGLPASNVTTVALAIAGHTFAGDTAGAGDVVRGTYSSAITGSNVMAANTLYEVGVVVQPTGGIVAAVTKGIHIWVRPILSAEN